MDKQQFFALLKKELSVLPDADRLEVIQYYEDYFLDADGKTDEQIISELGHPSKIAEDILNDYRELQPSAPPANPPKKHKLHPIAIICIALAAIFLGLPILLTLFVVLAVIFGTLIGILILILLSPILFVASGLGLCFVSLFLWTEPASAILTLGAGIICVALGGFIGILLYKLISRYLPALFRKFVSFLKNFIHKIGGRL